MRLVGAQIDDLTHGSATISVARRDDLLQQHGLFHGGVTAFLVDNATTIAAATSRGQSALTAEYKLNLLSPAAGERLICRARVIKPGRQVAVVAADVFCVTDGVEKHTATALASIAMLDEKAVAFRMRAVPDVATYRDVVKGEFEWDVLPFPGLDAQRPGVPLVAGDPNSVVKASPQPELIPPVTPETPAPAEPPAAAEPPPAG